MRFSNLSDFRVPKGLWQCLAAALRLDGVLPGTLTDERLVYGDYRTLRVTIRPRRRLPPGVMVISASHTYGHISISPCTRCTLGSLTHVYLHELFHAWLFQYHRRLYSHWDHCEQAERFADAGFAALGGRMGNRDACASYAMNLRVGPSKLGAFDCLASSLITTGGRGVKVWKPMRRPRRTRVTLKANHPLKATAGVGPAAEWLRCSPAAP